VLRASADLNDAWYSTNGVNWTEATPGAAFPGRFANTGLFYDNAMWVIGGVTLGNSDLNDVWYSPY
jgi:leucine-zipper-like transcriptional regulator 1